MEAGRVKKAFKKAGQFAKKHKGKLAAGAALAGGAAAVSRRKKNDSSTPKRSTGNRNLNPPSQVKRLPGYVYDKKHSPSTGKSRRTRRRVG